MNDTTELIQALAQQVVSEAKRVLTQATDSASSARWEKKQAASAPGAASQLQS